MRIFHSLSWEYLCVDSAKSSLSSALRVQIICMAPGALRNLLATTVEISRPSLSPRPFITIDLSFVYNHITLDALDPASVLSTRSQQCPTILGGRQSQSSPRRQLGKRIENPDAFMSRNHDQYTYSCPQSRTHQI